MGSVERPQTTTIFSPSQTLKKARFTRKQSHDCSIESIENLYTLRKVTQRVKDKVVPWFNLALAERATTSNIIAPQPEPAKPSKLLPYQTFERKKVSEPA